jgi:glycosyltransferase involved in cell wall biosynthesis
MLPKTGSIDHFSDNFGDSTAMSEKEITQESYSKKIQIQELIKRREYAEANRLLEEYADSGFEDADIYGLQGMIELGGGNLADAETSVRAGLSIDSGNVNLLYHMGYLLEEKGLYNRALNYYYHAMECSTGKITSKIKAHIDQLESGYRHRIKRNRKKIVFFVRKQMDHFLPDVIDLLSDEYETRKAIITQYDQIDSAMDWADICWFEWCDGLIVYGSKLSLAEDKKIVCRLHRREVFENFIAHVAWEKVDRLIVVADHLKKLMTRKVPRIENRVALTTIYNGVDLNRYSFKKKSKGFNLACICYIDGRKNPSLLLQIIKKLVELDSRYQLYLAGKFVEPVVESYWHYQIHQMRLAGNVVFDGWQNNIDHWLEDKDYLLSTSIHESFGYSIAEAMAKGIKPVIHDFLHAREIWGRQYLFNTVDQAVAMITSPEYNSAGYRQFIADNFSIQQQKRQIEGVLMSI